jgi:hypothetical protein
MQAIWDLILDERFMEMYRNGVVVKFFDGILRRIFPRFYTYSADYPEKCVTFFPIQCLTYVTGHRALLATIRSLGNLPCPRCLIENTKISAMGTLNDMKQRLQNLRLHGTDARWPEKVDMVRKFIFEKGYAVNSRAVERVLAETSLVPTRVCAMSYPE